MEQQLKQRLVGAVVLISLAVIFIPIILEGPDDEWTPRDHTIPEPPQVDYRAELELSLPEVLPEAEPSGLAAAETAQPTPAPASESSDSTSPPAAAKVADNPEPAGSAAQPAQTALGPGWYAQVGSFSQPANAGALRERINASGFRAHLQQAAGGKGTSYRVLVGPEASREQAEKLLGRLDSTLKMKGIVIGIEVPEN